MTNKENDKINFDELLQKVPVALTFLPVLKLLAQKQDTMTYKELGQLFGIHQKAIPSYLRILDIYCATRKLPHLNHLVVHQSTQVAGGRNMQTAPMTFHDQLQEQDEIYGHGWAKDPIPTESTIYDAVVNRSVA